MNEKQARHARHHSTYQHHICSVTYIHIDPEVPNKVTGLWDDFIEWISKQGPKFGQNGPLGYILNGQYIYIYTYIYTYISGI